MFKRIISLRYHSIEPKASGRMGEEEMFYNVTPDEFRAQMRYLKENGYETVSMSELLRVEDERELPKKPIILTFDDGHISHCDTVLPILEEFGLAGAFFIVVNETVS